MNRKYVSCAAALALLCGGASAQVNYADPTGDLGAAFTGFPHLDLVNVSMNNDATNLFIDITVNGDIAATNWGKYCILFDTKPGGVSSPSNPWGRAINTPELNDFWLGSWVDSGGGAQLWKNNGVVWDGSEFAATYIGGSGMSHSLANAATGTVSFTIALSNLGLVIGNTFFFDVMSTAGGTTDPGVDHLSLAVAATPDWGTPSNSGQYRSYTVIPTPGTLALAGLGLLAGCRRRR